MEGTIEDVEELFAVRRFEEASETCEKLLRNRKDYRHENYEKQDLDASLKKFVDGEDKIENGEKKYDQEFHRLISIYFQILVELKREKEIVPLLQNVYTKLYNVPMQIFFMLMSLEIRKKRLEVADRFVQLYLKKRSLHHIQRHAADYNTLAQVRIRHILIPLERYEESYQVLDQYQKVLTDVDALKQCITAAQTQREQILKHTKKTVTVPPAIPPRSAEQNLPSQTNPIKPKHLIKPEEDCYSRTASKSRSISRFDFPQFLITRHFIAIGSSLCITLAAALLLYSWRKSSNTSLNDLLSKVKENVIALFSESFSATNRRQAVASRARL